MISPAEYDKILEETEELMDRARLLGMYRMAEKLHKALKTGRNERFEAQPKNVPTLEWTWQISEEP